MNSPYLKRRNNEMMKTFLEATTDSVPEGMIMIDAEGVIVKTNRMLQRIVHAQEKDLVGKKLRRFYESNIQTSSLNEFRHRPSRVAIEGLRA